LIRALGASLGQFGVPQPLADSTIEVVDKNGLTVATNDDWNGNAAASTYFNTNPNLRPGNATDAAAVLTLAPGVYTVIVRGKNGGSGTALAEVYAL